MPTAWLCLREGIDVFLRRFIHLFGAWLAIAAIGQLVDRVIPAAAFPLQLLLSIGVLPPLYAGQYLLALKAVRHETTAFRQLLAGYRQWGTLVAISVLVSLLLAVGFFLFIVPAVVWALTYAFAPIVVLEQADRKAAPPVGPVAAMRASRELTVGYRGVLFRISLLLAVPSFAVFALAMLPVLVPAFPLPLWAIELVSLLAGTLFLGPVHAAAYMVAYDSIRRLRTKPRGAGELGVEQEDRPEVELAEAGSSCALRYRSVGGWTSDGNRGSGDERRARRQDAESREQEGPLPLSRVVSGSTAARLGAYGGLRSSPSCAES